MDYQNAVAKQAYSESADSSTFMSPLQMAAGGSREVAARLEALANRLVGVAPPSGLPAAGNTSNKLNPVPSSVFEQVGDLGQQINGDLGVAFEAINRIERALP